MKISFFFFISLWLSMPVIAATDQPPILNLKQNNSSYPLTLSVVDEKLIKEFQKYVDTVPKKVRLEALRFKEKKLSLLTQM